MDKNMDQRRDDTEFPDEKTQRKQPAKTDGPYADRSGQTGSASQQAQQSGANSAGAYGQDDNLSRQLRRENRNFMGSVGSIGAYGSLGAGGSARFTGAYNPASDAAAPTSPTGDPTLDEAIRANEASRQNSES